MATVKIPDENRTLTEPAEMAAYLSDIGITYERWEPAHAVADDAPADDILSAYAAEIEELKARGGYVTADVIQLKPDTPNLDVMLDKFKHEHWHDEDEVRFVIQGSGVFHIHPEGGQVCAIEVHAGDLLCVPRGTWHWFDLCEAKEIRCIRLFQDPAGWTPHYTGSGVDEGFQPMCLGPNQLPAQS